MIARTSKTIARSLAVVSALGMLQFANVVEADSQTPQQGGTITSTQPVHVTVRVEGYGDLHFARRVTVTGGTYKESDGTTLTLSKPTVLGALLTALEGMNESYVVRSTQWGPYLSAIGQEKEKDLNNSNTGWSFWLNGQPLQVGADQQMIKDGDMIVCGFYDYSKTLYPVLTLSSQTVVKGTPVTVTLSATQTTYDANWNPSIKQVKIAHANVHFGDQVVETDENGQATFTPKANGNVLVYADEYGQDGLPLIVPSAIQVLHVQGQSGVSLSDLHQVDWAANAIADLAAKSVVQGDVDGAFHPARTITRAEMVAMLVAAAGATSSGSAKAYPDVDAHAWYNSYIRVAAANGFLNGDPQHHMRPNAVVTREELAVMLVHAAGLDQEIQSVDTSFLNTTFTDAAQIQDWAKAYVAVAVSHHLLQGLDKGRFAPQGLVTRAQAAVAIDNLMKMNAQETK